MAPKEGCSKMKRIEEVILIKQGNNLTEKKRGEREKRPWSDLPADLLIDIMVRNYSRADQIRFRAVCKGWQQLPIDHVENAEINTLPWVVTGDWTDNLAEEEENEEYRINNNDDTSSEMSSGVLNCKLFDPKHPNPYSVNKILFKDRRTRICSSKHGWLFFEKKTHNNNLTSFFFLFSPFTQQIIHFPDLDNFIPGLKSTSSSRITFSYATFSSSDPYNDPDCEFFVIRDCYPDCNYRFYNRIAVSTCRRGDQNWTTRVFDKTNIQVNWTAPIKQMLYSTQLGYLCCFSAFNVLVAYSVTRKDWIQLINPQQTQVLDGMFYGRPHLIECEGGLLVVLVRQDDNGCRLFKFSWSSSKWNTETTLPNQAIFVGPTSFLVPASGDIANKIYYFDFDSENLKFYCLKDRQCHEYLRAADDDDDSLHRGWLAKGMLKVRVTWIQSP